MVENPTIIHASAFVYKGAGCLVLGEAGSGKSRLLAEAILHGAKMISDDQVALHAQACHLVARPVVKLLGVLELRGFGLIKQKDIAHSHPIHLIITLVPEGGERLPEPECEKYCQIDTPHLRLPPPPVLSVPSLLLYLEAVHEGRTLPADWHPNQ